MPTTNTDPIVEESTDIQQASEPKRLDPLDMERVRSLSMTLERDTANVRAAQLAVENAQLKQSISRRNLELFLGELAERYGVDNVQIDWATGELRDVVE